jgi:maltose alpha-D-glucosyltransferase/alpha-amylase
MVTDEERDYMYRAYAHDAEMRINLGIRRRLAPLVGNDRRKMELLHGLLFSLPGTPVLYYGDEIGMGDNVFLGDRNGVRTPMQWSADRNAGFSRANPQRLMLPVIIDPEYHFEAINVEAQQNNPNSLLWWTKRLVALRKQFVAFGRGTMEPLTPSNNRVLSFVRETDGETVLVVANLSRFPQYVELDLAKWKGMRPRELLGHTAFPPIGELPYLLTLSGHAFYWFSIEAPPAAVEEERERAEAYVPPVLAGRSVQALLLGDEQVALEDVLPRFLESRRWFGGRPYRMTGARVVESVALGGVYVLVARIDYADHETERYVMPLAVSVGADERPPPAHAVVAILRAPDLPTGEAPLVDAMEDPDAARALLDALRTRARALGSGGSVETTPFVEITIPDSDPVNISARHAAAAVRYDDRYLLKTMRRLEDGESPELELGRALNARAPGLSPEIVGAIEYRRPRSAPSTLAVLQAYVPNEGTAWSHAMGELGRFFERVLTRHRQDPPPEAPPASLLATAAAETPGRVREVIGSYLELAALLGQRTAEMHLALAASRDGDLAPEAYGAHDRRSKYQSMRNLVGRTLRLLQANVDRLPAEIGDVAHRIRRGEARILELFKPDLERRLSGLRMRIHGDFHLQQALYTGRDFVIIDLDGVPGEVLADRRRKHTALRDVAGMIRSFHYVAGTAFLDAALVRAEDHAIAAPWTDAWHRWVSGAFLRSYLATTAGAPFLPSPQDMALILDAQIVVKALRELGDELDRCAETVTIPLGAIAELAKL